MKARLVYLIGSLTLAIGAVVVLIATASAGADTASPSSVSWTDNFSTPTLNSRWSWIREEPTHWSLTARSGFLRITTQSTFNDVNNLLVQNTPIGDYELQTRVVFAPSENYQIAGLLVYQNDSNYLALGHAYCNTPPPACLENAIYFDLVENGSFVGGNFATAISAPEDVYFKLTRQANVYTGYVSTDGANWALIGTHTATIMPAKIGFKASNQIQGAAEIAADFDFFTIVDNSSRLFLPLLLKMG